VKRLPVRLRAQAHQDIKEIFDWIASGSNFPSIAENFVNRIYDQCEALAEFPLRGRARDDVRQGIRMLAFERKAVFIYRAHSDEVEVLNISYGGRDWEAIMAEQPDE
jgi:toxin ParE1/3/4